EQPEHVVGQVDDVVGVDGGRLVGAAVPTLVGGDGVVPGPGQRRQLVPPRVPELGEAVAEHDERALPLLGDVHVDAVGADDPEGGLVHEGEAYGNGAGRVGGVPSVTLLADVDP